MPCKLAISSMSLGRCYAGHSFEYKLDMAQKYGYHGIEIFHEDLAALACELARGEIPSSFSPAPSSSPPSPSTPTTTGDDDPPLEAQLAAASHIHRLCSARGLQIVCLQPFMHYEGLLDRAEHARCLEKLRLWIRLAHALHTDIVQIPSTFLPADQVSEDRALLADDLREAADLVAAADPPLRIAYEALAWGTRAYTWEAAWELVRRVDRPNFGTVLDTFNIAARAWADPAAASGRVPGADAALAESLARMLRTVDVRKVFYVQVVDAERLAAPLVKGHKLFRQEQPARMSWSRACRLFYGEQDRGAYLPVREIAEVVFHGLKFEGWVSLELFNRRMADRDPAVPEELARRGAVSWKQLVEDLSLEVESEDHQEGCVDRSVPLPVSGERIPAVFVGPFLAVS